MPLFISFIVFTILVAFVLSINASSNRLEWVPPTARDNPTLYNLANIMPQSTLPVPTGQLKYVLLGIGTQNYTCRSSNTTATPIGALAKLYDIGTRLNDDESAQKKLDSISCLALSLKAFPDQLNSYLKSQGYSHILGEHFFTHTTPTFFLYKSNQVPLPLALVAKKSEMDAPKYSCPGAGKEGAVKWLQLTDDKGLSQGGINMVYRLETAGGEQKIICESMNQGFEIPYAAQYWIFGPAT